MLRFLCLAISRDWRRWIRATARSVAYLARYAKQEIDHVEQWPISKVALYTHLTSEIVDKENQGAKGKKR